jgi:diguanylate cyclase (GGDEF)-like protein/PAS domain S-box-containing protein
MKTQPENGVDKRSATAAPTSTELQHQLLVYAQDLHDLMELQVQLQQRYQCVLQAHGRRDQNSDVLLSAARQACAMYLVTDAAGKITYASPAADRAFSPTAGSLKADLISEITHPSSMATVGKLLDKLSSANATGAMELRKLQLHDGAKGHPMSYDALVIPARKLDHIELIWLLEAEPAAGASEIEVQKAILSFDECDTGLFLTDPSGTIQAANSAFTRITGYSAAEAVGKKPSLLSAGRQDSSFYGAFWAHLIDDGSWTGEFFNRRKNSHIYTEWKTVKAVKNEQGVTVSYIAAFTDISTRASDAEQLARLAYHDALTGLPNERLLEDRMSQAIATTSRSGTQFCVMLLDLHQFKRINEEIGHDGGDRILQAVAGRIKASVRDSDTVARVGGDEFVVLLQSPINDEVAFSVASKILGSLGAPIQIAEHAVTVRTSIGCARYPVDGDDIATLLKHADAAKYGAKRFGLEFSFFDTGVVANPAPDMGFDIWRALERNEMSVVYQPQVTPDNRKVVRGCEALLRWNHASLGDVAPSVFIPIAEKNGAIIALGDWVLDTACRHLRQWHDAGLHELTLSVHVSSRQLLDPDFPERVQQILHDSGVDAAQLEMEISEADAMRLLDKPATQSALRELGVKIAVVDFGVGSSSLPQIRSLQVDRLKISQRFVRNLVLSSDAQALSQCFVGIGSAMGLDVTAGGVESAGQLEILAAQGCDLVQGYYTGKPMPAGAFLDWALAP